jgi:hypothetical protein
MHLNMCHSLVHVFYCKFSLASLDKFFAALHCNRLTSELVAVDTIMLGLLADVSGQTSLINRHLVPCWCWSCIKKEGNEEREHIGVA